MTPDHFTRRLIRAGRKARFGGWAPAFLAARARRDGVKDWAFKIGRSPDINRSAKTVTHWARAVEVALSFVPVIGRRAAFAYNVSVWLAIAPYAETVERALLADMLAAFTAEQCSVEQLEATLRETFGDGDGSAGVTWPVFIIGESKLPLTGAVVYLGEDIDDWRGGNVRVVRVK